MRFRKRAYWTVVPFLRRFIVDPDSGQAIEAERFQTAGLVEGVLAEAAVIRRLPEPGLASYVVDTTERDEGGSWPGRIYRCTGIGAELVARCESVLVAGELADLLNRREAQRVRRTARLRLGSPY